MEYEYRVSSLSFEISEERKTGLVSDVMDLRTNEGENNDRIMLDCGYLKYSLVQDRYLKVTSFGSLRYSPR